MLRGEEDRRGYTKDASGMPVGEFSCESCGSRWGVWDSYWCGSCGEHSDAKYRHEHRDPITAMFMNRADIIEEYHMAGIPFRAMGG